MVAQGTVVCAGDRVNDLEVHKWMLPQTEVPTHPSLPYHPLMPHLLNTLNIGQHWCNAIYGC